MKKSTKKSKSKPGRQVGNKTLKEIQEFNRRSQNKDWKSYGNTVPFIPIETRTNINPDNAPTFAAIIPLVQEQEFIPEMLGKTDALMEL